jgi:bile acid:Na+ symporter, BASS family
MNTNDAIMKKVFKIFLVCSVISMILATGILIFGKGLNATGPFVISALICLAIGGLD